MADIRRHFNKESGKYKCNYCGHDLAASTSTTRLRGHLIGVPNTGTKSCPNVPDDVRRSLSLSEINKRRKTATNYIPSPSNLPPAETEGMTGAMMLVSPPNGSGANNYFGNQGQHTMPLQYVVPLGETSEGQENYLRDDDIPSPPNLPPAEREGMTVPMTFGLPPNGLREAVMPPNETSSNPHQIESAANNHHIPFSPEQNNDFSNQGGLLQYTMSTHPNERGSVENFDVENYVIEEYMPPCVEDQTNEDTAEAAACIETYIETCSLSNDGWISDHYQKSLEDQTNEDTMVENESNLQHGEIARSMEGITPANKTGSNRVSPTADVLMSTHPNESGSVENFPLPNDMIGRTTQLQHPFTNEDLIQTLLEEQTNDASLMEETSNFPLKIGAVMAPTDRAIEEMISYFSRYFGLMDQADQHEVRNEVTVRQAVRMVEGNQGAGESASRAKRPVGEAFVRNVKDIWSWLMDDQVLRVGIYGMGGVGKTTLMRYIQTLLEGQSSFEVYWITVSQDFSISRLQNLIAKKIGLNFSDEEDQVERAKKLAQAIQAKGKCVLILDDLWNYFDVDEMGIPVGVNLCKLVLTTRLLKVCRQMDCSEGNTIQLQRLSDEEAWILFTQELGNYGTEVEELAKAVSRECAGLPLGIRVMARSMKGISVVHTWRTTLEELKESNVRKGHEMWEEVFSVLKVSYLRLNDQALQECLSYCALFPEDEKIDRDELIEYMIVEEIIDAKKNRRAELDRGHAMLDTLENACLLEGDTGHVWMHDLIRDMVILELREGSKMLVEAGAQLKELPDVEKWTENLVRVSLISNDIEVIPSGHTPRCPNLSTLLLRRNHRLRTIADSFFEQFQGLKVLDLYWCIKIEELPRSISDLVNLTALLLRGCGDLTSVPSLEKLEKLKKLDFSYCKKIKQMPEGVRFLLNLKYLDLSWTLIEEIGSGIIPMLSRLQVLKFCDENGDSKLLSIRGSEVGELRRLETLYCVFNVREFGEYVKSRERSQQSPSDYSISIRGKEKSNWLICSDRRLQSRKFVSVRDYSFTDPLALPTDIEALHILSSNSTMNEGFPSSNYSTHSLSNHSLLNLKQIKISGCHMLKKLFPPVLLPNLPNLQHIWVYSCYGMEEIFSTDREEEDGQELLFDQSNLTGLHLSRLTTLVLRELPELRSIYKGAIICHSLQQIELVKCPKLKRITLSLPQPSLQRIQVYPKEWWESVQWGEANDKMNLQSLCVFEKLYVPLRKPFQR